MSSLRQDPSQRPGPSSRSRMRALGPAGEAEPGRVLSVVVPAKNEAESLPQLVSEIAAALRPLRDESVDVQGGPRSLPLPRLEGFEVVIVDDGSTDETPEVLRRLEGEYPELRPFRWRGTSGNRRRPPRAFAWRGGTGWQRSTPIFRTIPADLVNLWAALPGHDAVLGWRSKREDVWSKRVISRWANRVRNHVLGQSIRDTGCSVRIFSREMALRLPMFQGCHRFFGPLLSARGMLGSCRCR